MYKISLNNDDKLTIKGKQIEFELTLNVCMQADTDQVIIHKKFGDPELNSLDICHCC